MITHPQVWQAFRAEVWAMHPDYMERMALVALARLQGVKDDAAAQANQITAAAVHARAENAQGASSGSVAVIPIFGTILPRGSMDMSGPSAVSADYVGRQIRAAVDDPSIKAIILDMDTPGGAVTGTPELADIIYANRDKKDIVAISDGLCASAGLWIAASCTSFWATPSSLTGSLGVYCAHEDASGALEKLGVKMSLISYGDNKTQGNPYEPLPDAVRDKMLARVTSYGKDFEKAVARGRGVDVAKVRVDFGQGDMFRAKDAKSIGMIDKIGTFDDLLATYGVSRPPVSVAKSPSNGSRAESDPLKLNAGAAARERELALAGA